ncbi:MAG TPA: glutamate--cysteine ligase [Nocardioides sp.]|nr:glutamate--cysteine ligase [Nocardioides sp.]
MGVEEELMLVDPETGRLTAVAQRALRARAEAEAEAEERIDLDQLDESGVEAELFLQQIETTTPPCDTMDELDRQLRQARRTIGELALDAGAAVVAVPTPVMVDTDASVTPQPRYQRIREEFGELAKTSLACAMHVHVGLDRDEDGAVLLGDIGPWLPVLLAISANSPYWRGHDTGYASWRTQIWTRWPSNGTGEPFESRQEYDDVTRRLVDWGAAIDDAMVYFDARLSRTFPTLEIRVADVCTEPDDAILFTALARALVTTAASRAGSARPPGWRSDLMRGASWRASRYGMAAQLVDPTTLELAPARAVVESLVHQVRDALDDAGDLALVEDLLERLLSRGGGATQQRRTFEAEGTLEAVVADLRMRTEKSWSGHATGLGN